VGKVLLEYHGPDAQELAKFILLCDKFFDCLNVRSFKEHEAKKKPELAPYTSVEDERFAVCKVLCLLLFIDLNNNIFVHGQMLHGIE